MSNNKAGEHTQGELFKSHLLKQSKEGITHFTQTLGYDAQVYFCTVCQCEHSNREQQEILMKSAPKMLEAIEHLLAISEVAKQHIGVWSNSKNHNPELEDGLIQYIAEAKAAIKSAKGE